MNEHFIASFNANRTHYTRGAEDMTMRKRVRLSMIRRRGRVLRNMGGLDCRYQIKTSKPAIQGYSDGQPISYGNHSPLELITLPWRGLITTDSMTLFQYTINTGDSALVRQFQDKVNNMHDAMDEGYHGIMFLNGDDANRQDLPHGLETFTNYTQCTAADIVAMPNDTYGTGALPTNLGGLGGRWSQSGITPPNAALNNDWPNGQGDREYDANSPVLINYNSTGWGTGSQQWAANCWRAISQGITWAEVNSGSAGQPTNVCLGKDLWQPYKNHHEPLRRINIPHVESQDLGFGHTLNQDGVAIHSEFDCPSNVGYIENLNQVEIATTVPNMFWFVTGNEAAGQGGLSSFLANMDMAQLAMLLAGGHFGQIRYRPKYVSKIGDFTQAPPVP